jgi:hypothetical protein
MSKYDRLSDIILEKEGPQLIAEERQRQIAKGYTPEYDQRWKNQELTMAARVYLCPVYTSMLKDDAWRLHSRSYWRWPIEKFQRDLDHPRRLIMAGALMQAELDRLRYLGKSSKASENRVKQCGKRATSWLKRNVIRDRQAARAAERAGSRP